MEDVLHRKNKHMNTFFRQKLTNKTIDLLEKVEDRKTREEEEDCLILESPTILAIISLPALIILGIIVPIIAIREGDYIWGIIGMIIFGGMCSWLTGYSLFWKVVINHEKVEYHSSFFGIRRSYRLKDITKVYYDEVGNLKIYKGTRKVFTIESGTYGIDDLVEWFAEEGVFIEDCTPRKDFYKVLKHPQKAWIEFVAGELVVMLGLLLVAYIIYRDFPLDTTKAVWEVIASEVYCIGNCVLLLILIVRERVFYLQYQNGRYSYHCMFHEEETFELDDRITYKAVEDGIIIYRDEKRLFKIFHGYANAEFFGKTLLEKNIKCIKGEQYMEKYRDKEESDAEI